MKNNEIPQTMKAAVAFGNDIDLVEVRELPVPEPGPNQLLCTVEAAGVCTSILKLVAQGKDHPYLNGWDPAVYPIILGDEGSLTVVRAGKILKRNTFPEHATGFSLRWNWDRSTIGRDTTITQRG